MTLCPCCGCNLGVLLDGVEDERCNRCFLGFCGCRLTEAEQSDSDAKIDRLAAEGDRMERDARPWMNDVEPGEGARDGS